MEQRYAEAKAVAEHYPADNPKARQLAFEKQLERSTHAKLLREAAKRLHDEAERLELLADGMYIAARQGTTAGVSLGVLGKVAEGLRLRAEQNRPARSGQDESTRAAGE